MYGSIAQNGTPHGRDERYAGLPTPAVVTADMLFCAVGEQICLVVDTAGWDPQDFNAEAADSSRYLFGMVGAPRMG